jgi:NAD(P)-dependent dehydrogenase (short-subunit alcohol dehydrogenase family)
LITGTSSGLGLATTEAALAQGDIVIATLRKPEALASLVERYPASQLHVIKVDTTQRADVEAVFAYAKTNLGRVDVVFNNAGAAFGSEFETAPEAESRGLFDVNFWGAVYVTQEAIKFFREVNAPGTGGFLLQCSSIVGIISPPGASIYNATKHALEAITESLAGELNPDWNIKVTLLEFGRFLTPGYKDVGGARKPVHPAYLDASGKPRVPNAFVIAENMGSPAKAGAMLWKFTKEPNPPLRLAVGKDAIALVRLKANNLLKGVEENASWSEDLEL